VVCRLERESVRLRFSTAPQSIKATFNPTGEGLVGAAPSGFWEEIMEHFIRLDCTQNNARTSVSIRPWPGDLLREHLSLLAGVPSAPESWMGMPLGFWQVDLWALATWPRKGLDFRPRPPRLSRPNWRQSAMSVLYNWFCV
jgi:hypothetical protein